MKSQEFAALRHSALLDSVGQEAEVTDAHETIGQDVQQEAANEFVGIERHGLFSISIFAIPVAESDLAIVDIEDTIIG